MKKTVYFVLSVIACTVIMMACDKQKSMQEYIREEKKAIERYIEREGIVVKDEYPAYEDFMKNEKLYFRTGDGLYIHVVDSGNGTRARALKDEILVRFEFLYYIKSFVSGSADTLTAKLYMPIAFDYGRGSYATDMSGLACDGWAIPLQYVGEKAIVHLIIPSSLGNSTDNNSFEPVFYKNLQYTKFN